MYRSYGSSVPDSHPLLDVDSTLRGLTQDFCTAFNTGNYDQAAALFAPDGLFMPPNHEAAQGPKAVEHALREFGEGGYQDLRLESRRVDCSGDMAVEIGRYTIAVQQANGTTVVDRGKFIHAWRRLGVWLLIATAWNSNLPVGK